MFGYTCQMRFLTFNKKLIVITFTDMIPYFSMSFQTSVLMISIVFLFFLHSLQAHTIVVLHLMAMGALHPHITIVQVLHQHPQVETVDHHPHNIMIQHPQLHQHHQTLPQVDTMEVALQHLSL